MSNVREMIQIAFEYETKIAQIMAEAKRLQAENEDLKKTLAMLNTANNKPLSEAKVRELTHAE